MHNKCMTELRGAYGHRTSRVPTRDSTNLYIPLTTCTQIFCWSYVVLFIISTWFLMLRSATRGKSRSKCTITKHIWPVVTDDFLFNVFFWFTRIFCAKRVYSLTTYSTFLTSIKLSLKAYIYLLIRIPSFLSPTTAISVTTANLFGMFSLSLLSM